MSKILNRPLDEQVGEEEMEEEEEEEYEANPKINTRVPAVVEIKKALKELCNGKATVDNISPEVMKVHLDITANICCTPYSRRYGLKDIYQMTGNVAY